MTLIEIFSIILLHWIADFLVQTRWQGENKSKSWIALLGHTLSYTGFWLLAGIGWVSFILENGSVFTNVLWFCGITFILHTATDYFTSRWTSKLFEKKKMHIFWAVIGLDQILHYMQLFITYKLLFYA